ncbi:ABC transporter substrate-binding protein [Streptomyces sp. ACA25]|uniref:ABC transporter substrate-binding protein n=1 Tax=Streptomyces sp. ACA25 TaxID=3022596 RepID=UPI0023076FDA|nr:ABC transporter substrate-binding protein [Streptomyces sp. ACA25]MDB1088631.1 ABC transporter substrate-binding protein [Streptomyces sp. ACA25]
MSIRKATMRGIAVAAAGSLALTACGSGDDGGSGNGGGDVTLNFTWWGSDERAERYDAAVKLFQEKHPGIRVQTSFNNFEDYWNLRNTDATSGGLPDVLQMDLSYLWDFAGNGLLADLGDHTEDRIDLSGLDEELVSSGEVDGGLFAIPTGTNTLALLYNPGLLEDLGVDLPDWDYTWEDYRSFLAEVSEAGADRSPAVHGGDDYTTVWWLFMQGLVQEGIEPFGEDGEMNFSEDDMRDWLASAEDIREPVNLTFPITRAEQLDPLSGFTAGEAAVEFHWDNFLAGYTNELGVDDLGLMPVPGGADGQKNMFFKPTMQLAMGANSDHPEEAALLIDFLINDPEAGAIFGTDMGVPSSQSQRDSLDLEEGSVDARVIAYEEAVSEAGYMTAVVPRPVPGFGSVENEYSNNLGDEFSHGQIDVDSFVDRWFSEAPYHLEQ